LETATLRRSDLILAALLCLIAAPAPAQTMDQVLVQMRDYLNRYESELSRVVGEEQYLQEEFGPDNRGNTKTVRRAELVSDVAFLRLPGNGYWYGTRETKRVNGRLITTKGLQIADLIAATDIKAKHEAMMLASSAHNLGEKRSINMPTVPLEILRSSNSDLLTFKNDGAESVRGRRTSRIAFEEIGESTLIGHEGALPAKVGGRVWVDAADGRIWRVELECRFPKSRHPESTRFTIRVDFTFNPELSMLVPASMSETFPATIDRGKGYATYKNFRRFRTSARIITPPPQ
jgi:hypothetical protein